MVSAKWSGGQGHDKSNNIDYIQESNNDMKNRY